MKVNFYKLIPFFAVAILFVCVSYRSVHIPAERTITCAGDTIRDQYLELKGNVRQSKGLEAENVKPLPVDSALITIYCGNVPWSELFTNKKGKCIFRLPLDKQFRVEVSKKGFITKSVEVNTKIPYDNKGSYSFTFDIDIFEEVKGLDVTVLKKPVAKVSYNLIHESFQYDAAFTNRINAELKKMYKNYYALQKEAADSLALQSSSAITDSIPKDSLKK
ncbi:MAG: hypothetical protein M3R27_02680 [Bacteroidota bacterium]|nr:hypothetical protein [Bacteroidota bacterium]